MTGRSRVRGVRLTYVGVRLSDQAVTDLDERARTEGLVKSDGEPNRSEMLRLMVAYAKDRMPAGWRGEEEV